MFFVLPLNVGIRHSHLCWDIPECQNIALSHETAMPRVWKVSTESGSNVKNVKSQLRSVWGEAHDVSVQSQPKLDGGRKTPWELAYLLVWGRQLDGLLLGSFSKELGSRGRLSLKAVCGSPDLRTRAIRRVLKKRKEGIWTRREGGGEGMHCGELFKV